MHIEQEIELKTLITQNQYIQLLDIFFPNIPPLVQTNTYFDTPSRFLKNRGQALRVRQSSNNAVLTLKSKQDSLTSNEITVPFHNNILETATNYPDLLTQLPSNINELRPITTFTTQRHSCHLPFGVLFLDQTFFENKHSDFEIEIEIKSHKYIESANKWLMDNNITPLQASPKIARAIAQQSAQVDSTCE